jgi:hypothetical protein
MPLANRSLGLGFGKNNHFYIRKNEPNKLMVNELPFPAEILTEFRLLLNIEIKKMSANKETGDKNDGRLFSTILTSVLQNHYSDEIVANMVANTLALTIPDLLVDSNITRLNEHLLPRAMKDPVLKKLLGLGLNKFFMFSEEGELDFSIGIGGNNAPYYRPEAYFNFVDMQHDKVREQAQISQRFLKSLVVSKYIKEFGIPEHLKDEKEIDNWKNKILREQLAVIFYDLTGRPPKGMNINRINPKINLQDNDVYAYLVPAIMDRMSDEHLKISASHMANYLSLTDFKPLSSENYAKLNLKLSPQKAQASNENRRAFQFFPEAPVSVKDEEGLAFRGKKYKFQHTHIHFEKDGEEKEFVVKDAMGRAISFAGEIHSVFEYTPPEKQGKINRQKRLIAVHYPLEVVEDVAGENAANLNIQELLDDIAANKQKWNEKIEQWQNRGNKNDGEPKPRLNLEKALDFGKVFLKSLNEQSQNGELLHHTWASLRSSTHGFNSGLRFIISLKPIQVSENQYLKLKEVFGEMRKDLTEAEILDPIDRKAGWRKERTALISELTDLMQQSPALGKVYPI